MDQQPTQSAMPGSTPETPNTFLEQPSTPPAPAPNKKRKGLIIGGIIAAALVVLGGGGALAYSWYQNPEKVVADAVMNAIKAKTVTFTGELTVENDSKVKLELNGATDAVSGELAAKMTFPMGEKEQTLEANAKFDKNGDLYFKAKQLDKLVEANREQLPPESQATVDQLVAKINDRWVKVSADDLAKFDETSSKRQKCVADALKKYSEDSVATNEVIEVYKKNKFIKVEQNLGTKDGSLGYTLKGDKATAESFFKGLKDTKLYKTLHECDPSLELDEKQSSEQTTEQPNVETRVELWVSQWSHEVTELKFTANDKEAKASSVAFLKPKFNQPVNVEAPKDAISLAQLQADIEAVINSAMEAEMQSAMQQQELTEEEMMLLYELQASGQL